MDNVEDATSRGEGDVRPVRAVTRVDDQLGPAYVDGLEVESGSGVGSELTILWVQWLLSRDLFPVDGHISYRRYDAV